MNTGSNFMRKSNSESPYESKPRLMRTIEVISTRFSGENKQYVLSVTQIFDKGLSETRNKVISKADVKTHLDTGNWHQITASHAVLPTETKLAVQITEHLPLRFQNQTILSETYVGGTDEFSKLRRGE